jgi:plastocyanin
MNRRLIAAATAAILITGAMLHAATTTIEQAGQKFSERSVSLGTGDILMFANHDDVTHNVNVVDDDEDAIDLGLQKPGENLTYKFDKAGRFKVRCSIHPSMKMSVSVK